MYQMWQLEMPLASVTSSAFYFCYSRKMTSLCLSGLFIFNQIWKKGVLHWFLNTNFKLSKIWQYNPDDVIRVSNLNCQKGHCLLKERLWGTGTAWNYKRDSDNKRKDHLLAVLSFFSLQGSNIFTFCTKQKPRCKHVELAGEFPAVRLPCD